VLHALAEQQLSGAPGTTIKSLVEHLLHWRDGQLVVTAEPASLVVTVSGHRR
jgi:hypothetical protein